MKRKCLIVDEMHSSIIPMLEQAGFIADYRPSISYDEFISELPSCDGLVVRSKFYIDKKILSVASTLKFIARAGAGLDNIDVSAIEKTNIKLINAPEGNRDALAEHAMAMLLSLLNKLLKANQEVRSGVWDREGNRGFELKGKTVGIIGYGYMGRAFAQRLKSFGCTVLAYDKYLKDFSDEYVKEVSIDEIYKSTDILSLHIPLTTETSFMITDDFFRKFKKNIWFINTARGELVKLNVIVNALRSGRLRGAALDVLENEKLKSFNEEQQIIFAELVNSPNVILSPHIGGWTYESYEKINAVLIEKIKQLDI